MKAFLSPIRNARQTTSGFRRMMPLLVGCVVLLTLLSASRQAAGQTGFVDREQPIKAAYIYNFAKYVRWPDHCYDRASFVIGVVGESPITNHLQTIARSKAVQGMQLQIVRLKLAPNDPFCHIVFLPDEANDPKLAESLEVWQQHPTLLISDSEGFAKQTGVIEFFNEGNRVRFAINTTRAKARGLSISSKLLRLGTIVD